jgi:hypothetical protein
MNEILVQYAKDWINDRASSLTPDQRKLFKRMYCGSKYADRYESLQFSEIVNRMSGDQLNIAMMQIQRTLVKSEPKS